MDNFFAASILILGIVMTVLGFVVLGAYRKGKNPLSLYMMGFFFIGAIGWIGEFIFATFFLSLYESDIEYLLAFSLVSEYVLFLFVARLLEIKIIYSILVGIAALLVYILEITMPAYHILDAFSTIIIIVTVLLFFLIYKRQGDGKSLGFALGLICILMGEALQAETATVQIAAIFMLAAAVVLSLGFLGVFNRAPQKGKNNPS